MSTVPPTYLKQYLILVHDHPNTLLLRRATKTAHINGATPLIDAGRLTYYGVTLARHPTVTSNASLSSEPEISGSLMILHAASEQDVRELLANDPYPRQGVWDVANALIMPFKAD